MKFIADFHIHSKYSRATSKDMNVDPISKWAQLKGISLMATGDFTHPAYLTELKSKLAPVEPGLFRLKPAELNKTCFILTAEVSNMYSVNGRFHKIHTLLFAPSFEAVDKINACLSKKGNLSADGRPIFGFPVTELAKIVLDASPDCMIIPAHAWTPWFSVFGANSGFDSIEECFGDYARYIYAIETGLSSDPAMNWRLSKLDKITLLSNSDAHSPSKIGREVNVFDCKLDYYDIIDTIRKKDKKRFIYTIEFFPEEGKYHYDGHRDCSVLMGPEESKKNKYICPVCKKRLTVGVMTRVEALADRPAGTVPDNAIPYKSTVPLLEIISDAMQVGVLSQKVRNEYLKIVRTVGTEFSVLMDVPRDELVRATLPHIADAIMQVRAGKLDIVPGHDGVFGKISIKPVDKEEPPSWPPVQNPAGKRQMELF
ncbi:MAG: DNA helicase UvrD [Planctomycetes bacterium]|nr:DNA helicase UvrD [Planctomycetota bacterium]